MRRKEQAEPSVICIVSRTADNRMTKQVNPGRLVLSILNLLSMLATYSLLRQASTEQGWFWPRRLQVAFLLIGGNLIVFSVLLLLPLGKRQFLFSRFFDLFGRALRTKPFVEVLITISLIWTAYLIYGPYGQPFINPIVRLCLFAQTAWWMGIWLSASGRFRKKWLVSGFSLLLVGFGLNLGFFMTKISTHPFSLDWSETSRYYYASLFFSEQIYGIKTAWSPLHPSRYLLQSIPFLLHPLPLWVHRLWQVILWIFIPAATSWLLIRRLKLMEYRQLAWLYGYLFLMIGAVYYHLLVIPALILAFCDTRLAEKRMNLICASALVLASIWAGISRVNWLPMPAIVFVVLYLLERSMNGQKIWRYLAAPFVLSTLSLMIALLSSTAYIKLSGNPPTYFASSFTSDLIWERLLPNPTYYTGILLPITFVSVPVILAIIHAQKSMRIKLSWLRLLGLLSISVILFVVGAIVSAKIGGGSNLHNFDGYLVILLILLFYFLSGGVKSEAQDLSLISLTLGENGSWFKINPSWQQSPTAVLLYAYLLIVPLPFAIFQGNPVKFYHPARVEEALRALDTIVEDSSAENKEVLFITERHLLTFGYFPAIRLVPEYEKVWLMEMAMANRRDYLERFYTDLAKQRFSVIITTQTYVSPQGDIGRFGDENRAWRKRVNRPILCYYKPYLRFREFNFEILLPRERIRSQCR